MVCLKAKERLEETKRSLFQNETILNELQDIVLEHHARKNRESVSVEELQVICLTSHSCQFCHTIDSEANHKHIIEMILLW